MYEYIISQYKLKGAKTRKDGTAAGKMKAGMCGGSSCYISALCAVGGLFIFGTLPVPAPYSLRIGCPHCGHFCS